MTKKNIWIASIFVVLIVILAWFKFQKSKSTGTQQHTADNKDSSSVVAGRKTEFIKMTDTLVFRPGSIHYYIEHFNETDSFLFVAGWGFNESTSDNSSDTVFIVLKGEQHDYIAPVIAQSRPDITTHFKKINLDNAGFTARVYKDDVEKGKYTLGIAIKDKQGEFNSIITDKIIKVGMAEYAAFGKLASLPSMADIDFYVEDIRADEKQVVVQGWAFLNKQDALNSQIGIVLKNENDLYFALAEPMLRPDVSSHFKNRYKLDNSGFSIKFLKTALPKGRYQIGIIIRDNKRNKEGVIFTGKEIDI